MRFRWLLFIFFVLILLHTLEIEAWSGHVCTKYMITYLNESYCHDATYWWLTGKHACTEWKNQHKSRLHSVQYCCNGWKHNGDQLCTIRTDAVNVFTDVGVNNIPKHPEKNQDMPGKHLSLIKRQVANCGGNLTAQTMATQLSSPNYPNGYENNLSCNWTIQSPLNYIIDIRITDIVLEEGVSCSYDYLKINLGSSNTFDTDRICRMNNTELIFISKSNKADIIFVTDGSIAEKGFSLQYRAVNSVKKCGGNLAAETVTTTLTSPNYPYLYENNLRCNWTIQGAMNYAIVIRIIDINLKQSASCSRDYLKINMGGNNGLETNNICRKNNTDLIFISRSNKADIIFVTDVSVEKRGFLLQYQAVPSCGRGLTAQTWAQSLDSPKYPYQYPNNLYCHWTIEAGTNYRIGIRITHIYLKETSECSKDYLQIYLGSNPILETSKICRKNNTDVYFLSRSNEADVIFVKDGSTTKTGFSLQYQGGIDQFDAINLNKLETFIFAQSCGGNLTAKTRTTELTSPNYPYLYENNLLCKWTIQASNGYKIEIRIIDIDLEENSSCSHDYLKITMGCNSFDETDKVCGKNNTDLIFTSRSNKADAIFVTDGSVAKRGFLLQYQAVWSCGGSLTAQTWSISLNSPNYPYQYANNLYCYWTIEARKNYRIGIRITYIDLQESLKCSKDYLQIYLESNPILTANKICRKNNNNVYFLSISNKADVIFVTDGSITKTGFSLEYQEVNLDQGCVRNLMAQTWPTTLTSPNYHNFVGNNLRCNWTLEAPMNSTIAIRIIDIDLLQSANCSYDHLKINLGGNNVSKSTTICRNNNTNLIFISRSNKADVIFVTKGSGIRRGFLLQYQAGMWLCKDGSSDMNCHVDWDTPTQNTPYLPCMEPEDTPGQRIDGLVGSIIVAVVSLIMVAFFCWWCRRKKHTKSENNRQDLTRRRHDAMETEHSSRVTIGITISRDQEEREHEHYTPQQEMQRLESRPRYYRNSFTNYGYVEEVLNRASEERLSEAVSSVNNADDLMRSEYQFMETEHYSGATIDTAIDQEEGGTNNMDEEHEAHQSDLVSIPRKKIEDILSEIRDHINVSGHNTLYIKRSCIWESALEQFRKEGFNPMAAFKVKFVNDNGNEEGAIDAGGPRREYFQLMMDYLANCSLFDGPSGRKLLSYDVQANKRNEYFYAGMVIGQSILFNGPVPRFLSPLLLDCVILGPENVTGSRMDIYDSDWEQLLDEVQTTDCIRDFVLNHNKTMHIAGCLRNERMENRDQLIQDLINYYLAERTRPAFEKFKEGLKSVGVYNYILTYPDQFRELFSKHEPLTAEKMTAMFTINYTQPQEEDNEEVEQKTVQFWGIYLCIVEAGGSPINLEDIMMFATGMKEQPYGQSPKIYFSHPYGGNSGSKYPRSSTCSCTLYLPLHKTFSEFKKSMDFGILNGSEFGLA